jgi:hypothetical protein
MNFYQKKNKNDISIEINENELIYKLKDESININR